MNKAYRIYLGARNTADHTFSARDEELIAGALSRFFSAWTVVDGLGVWEGREEACRVITLTTRSFRLGAESSPVEACAKLLKAHLGQEAVLVEEGGAVTFF